MTAENLINVLHMVKHSNLKPTTKSLIGGVFKDVAGFDEEGYEEESKEHNEGEMDLIAQLQDLLQQLMDMEGEEMEGEEMEAEYEEKEEEEDEGGMEEEDMFEDEGMDDEDMFEDEEMDDEDGSIFEAIIAENSL